MKTLDRLIVTSATYRQSSKVTPEHRARDTRTGFTPARPHAHAVDAARLGLAASGVLDPRVAAPVILSAG